MIRFGVIVSVVVAAVGLLVVGAIAGELALVYGSIALAALALLLLIVGVVIWRDGVFASSAQRAERALEPAGAVGRPGRPAAGPGTPADRRDRPAATPGPRPAAGPGPGLQGGDTREFRTPIGALPERDTPAERDRHSAEPRPTEHVLHPVAGRPGHEPPHRDGPAREAVPGDRPGREAAVADRPGRDAAAERASREAAPGDRPGREAAAADRAAREPVSARRPDRVERYSTVVGSERSDPADDPTRLAHRLDSLTDFGRQAGPEVASSAPSPTGRPGGERLPVRAGSDPLAGPISGRRSAGDPLTAPSPGSGRATPAEPDRSPGADGDASVPSSPVPAAPVPSTAASARTMRLPTSATADLDPRGPEPRPRVPSGADPRPPAESAASAAPVGPTFGPPPATLPASREAGPAADEPGATVGGALAGGAAIGGDLVGGGLAGGATVGGDLAGGAPVGAAVGDSVPDSPAAAATATTDGGPDAPPALGPDDEVSVVPGIARYHKADCILIRFLSEDDLEVTSRRDAEVAGCAPCRACRPDRPSPTG